MPIENLLGAPAMGDNFFDRERDLARLSRRLHADNVLLLAPRRVGKTSVLHRLGALAEENGQHAVYLTVASLPSELAFIRVICEAIERHRSGDAVLRRWEKHLRELFGKLPRLKKIGVPQLFSAEFESRAEAEWRRVGEALLLALQEVEGRWLLMIDELPLFALSLLARDRARAHAFLTWFRDVRIDATARLSIRWILAGSIGLDTVAQRQRVTETINDLAIEPLGPFSAEDADAFLAALGQSYGLPLDGEVRALLLRRVGWLIPYHLQLMFAALRDHCLDAGVAPDPSAVDAAYLALLSPSRKSYFDYWVQRLADELGRLDAGHALAVLETAARDEMGSPKAVLREMLRARGVKEEAQVRFLLDVLEGDGYLVGEEGRYRFRSSLLRGYWLERVLP